MGRGSGIGAASLTSVVVVVLFTMLAWLTVTVTRTMSRPSVRRLRGAAITRQLSRPVSAGRAWVTARIAVHLLVLAVGTAAVFILVGLFAEVTESVVDREDLALIDDPVLGWLAENRSPLMTRFQVGITNLGSALGLTAMLLGTVTAVAIKRGSWRPVLVVAAGAVGIQLLVYTLKFFIGRDRPERSGRLVDVTGFSFPSGHSASSLVCFGLLAWLVCMLTGSRTIRATAWVAAALLTVAVGLSRSYLGVHYPSDVIGGWIIGSVWLTAVAVGAYALDRRRALNTA